LLAALLVYFLLDKLLVEFIFKTEKSEYLDSMNHWGREPASKNILNILLSGYIFTIGNIPAVQAIAEPVMARFARTGMQAVQAVSDASRSSGNILLLPSALFFLVQIISTATKKIPVRRRVLYVLAGIGTPLSILALSIAGGSMPPVRSLYVLPFAVAFMPFYLIGKYKKMISKIIICLMLMVSAYQAEIAAQLWYSDYMRYQQDVHLAQDIDRMLISLQNNGKKLPVALVGRYQAKPLFTANFLQGEVIGHSNFEWDGTANERGLAFMDVLGMHYERPDEASLNQAIEEAKSIPAYPAEGCVKRLPDLIVVKLSAPSI
jgi:hypothetical protein